MVARRAHNPEVTGSSPVPATNFLMYSFMATRHTTTRNKRFISLIILVEFLVIFYMIYALTSSVYKKHQINQYIQKFELENKQLVIDNNNKINDYHYYHSDRYAKKIAKQNFGLLNPGEEVIILPNKVERNETFVDLYEENMQPSKKENWELWVEFFFNK